jgi:predicted nucleotidyltransferase
MFNNKRQESILEDLKNKYKKDPNVLGIMVFGSLAQGHVDEYSDIDLYIILAKDDGRERIYKHIQGVRVDILFDSTDKIVEYLKFEKGKLWRNVSHMFAHGKILFSRSSKILRLQRMAKRNMAIKTRLSRDEQIMHIYSIEDYWYKTQRDAKNRDIIAFQKHASHILNNSIELVLKSHGAYLPPARELDAKLKQIDRTLRTQLLAFYKTSIPQKQLSALSALVRHMTKRFGEVPEGWTVKK